MKKRTLSTILAIASFSVANLLHASWIIEKDDCFSELRSSEQVCNITERENCFLKLQSSEQIYNKALQVAELNNFDPKITEEMIEELKVMANRGKGREKDEDGCWLLDRYDRLFALTTLGRLYYEGTLVEKDDEKAEEYLMEAIKTDPIDGESARLSRKMRLKGERPTTNKPFDSFNRKQL